MKIGVHMKDGSYRSYHIDDDTDLSFEKIIKTTKDEVFGSVRALVLVPRKITKFELKAA